MSNTKMQKFWLQNITWTSSEIEICTTLRHLATNPTSLVVLWVPPTMNISSIVSILAPSSIICSISARVAPDFLRILMGWPLDVLSTRTSRSRLFPTSSVSACVAVLTLACRYVFSQTSYFLALLTRQGDKLLVWSFEFDDQRFQHGRLLA